MCNWATRKCCMYISFKFVYSQAQCADPREVPDNSHIPLPFRSPGVPDSTLGLCTREFCPDWRVPWLARCGLLPPKTSIASSTLNVGFRHLCSAYWPYLIRELNSCIAGVGPARIILNLRELTICGWNPRSWWKLCRSTYSISCVCIERSLLCLLSLLSVLLLFDHCFVLLYIYKC